MVPLTGMERLRKLSTWAGAQNHECHSILSSRLPREKSYHHVFALGFGRKGNIVYTLPKLLDPGATL